MEENKVDFEMFLKGYENVQKQINEIGGEDKTEKIEALKTEIKKAEKEIKKITGEKGKRLSQKDFEIKSKPFMEKIKNNEAEIKRLEEIDENIKKDPEKSKKLKELTGAKKSIRENARNYYEKKMADNKEKVIDPKSEELEKIYDEYNAILDLEKKEPKRVKDEKYKEYLKQKISNKEKEIQLETKSIEKEFFSKYGELLKNFGRIDRGEKVVKSQTRQEQEAKERKRIEEENKRREAEKYDKDWAEAIEENKRRDAEKYDRDWAEAIEENKRRDAEKRKELMEKGIINAENSEPDRKRYIPSNLEIKLGRKGKVLFGGDTYKIPKKALKNISSLDKIDIKVLFEDAKINITNHELLQEALEGKAVDYAVIKGICSAKKMTSVMKADVLNQYLKECISASEFKEVKNSCNVVYDMADLSKLGGMNENEKNNFLERARRAERFNVGKTKGEYKPSFWSNLKSVITGKKLKLLSDVSREEEEVARRADEIMYREQIVPRNKEFVKELQELAERKDVEFGKYINDKGETKEATSTKLTDNQVEELKDVIGSQMSNLSKNDEGR